MQLGYMHELYVANSNHLSNTMSLCLALAYDAHGKKQDPFRFITSFRSFRLVYTNYFVFYEVYISARLRSQSRVNNSDNISLVRDYSI